MSILFQNKIKYETKWKFLVYVYIKRKTLSKNCNEQLIHNYLKKQ